MDENDSAFPSFEQKFQGACKAKIRGWISLGLHTKTVRPRHFWPSSLKSILNSNAIPSETSKQKI